MPAETISHRLSAGRHIESLDGIRALSFLVVFVSHAGLRRIIVPGDFGVTVFFFLSGFLITTLMRAEYQKNGSVNLRHFWLRRALRISPPFYLVLILAFPVTLALYPPGTMHASAVTAQLLHVTNYWIAVHGSDGLAPGTGVYWSLAVEEHFYLLFPWLYIAMQRWRMSRGQQTLLLWGLCALVLLWRYLIVYVVRPHGIYLGIATDTRIDPILFGCALAVWNNPVLDEPWQETRLWKYLLLPAALLALVLCLRCRNVTFMQTWYFTIQGAALTLVFMAVIRFHDWVPFRWLNFRPLAFMGLLSYSMYLTHDVLLHAGVQLLPQLSAASRALLALAATVLVAWVIYLLVERPCSRLRRRFTAIVDAESATVTNGEGPIPGRP